MKTLFLNPPSFQGFDGGAGSRYQARREIRSFWYPTWLAQAAAMVDDSRLVDAPADDLSLTDVLKVAREYNLTIIYTSTPSFRQDARTAAAMKALRPDSLIGMVGPHVTVLPGESLARARWVDFVVKGEFEYPVKELAEGRPLSQIEGVTWRDGDTIRHNPDRELVTDLDALPFVIDVYKRDLAIENYYIGYLMHPYLSIHTGRGCPARCTFCLWPQTMSGHTYRARSPESVCREMALARDHFPRVKEFFIDDDTFTANPSRAVEIARGLKDIGITWSTSSRVNASFDTLKMMKDNGLRLLMVGFESGSDEILRLCRKGATTDMSRRFMRDCRELGIEVHGTFMLGLPGETPETIEQTIRFAQELDPGTVQVSIAAPYPGTELYRQAVENEWLAHGSHSSTALGMTRMTSALRMDRGATRDEPHLVSRDGTQDCPLRYDNLTGDDIRKAVDRFYSRFYFRPRVLMRIGREMLKDRDVRSRRLREGREFLAFRKSRGKNGHESMLRRVIRDGGPGFCQFAITDACNANCAFCKFSLDESKGIARVFVDTDRACAALDILKSNGVDYLAFVGGEPTTHPGLDGIMEHASAIGMVPMLCTNGSLLDAERISRYAEAGLKDAIISVDACDTGTHEKNRAIPGLCDRISEATGRLRDAGISVTASVTLSKLIGDLPVLPAFLESLGFEQVTFSYPLRSLDSGFRGYSESELIDYSDAELCAVFEEVIRLKRRYHVVNPTASLREMQRFARGERQRFECLAGWKYFYLDWNFDLFRCHAWPRRMCSVFEFDGSRLVRDGCTKCMIDCYRDSSVMHHLGMAVHEAWTDLSRWRPGQALRRLASRTAMESAGAVAEELGWIRGLRRN